jgi:hypothetical protein
METLRNSKNMMDIMENHTTKSRNNIVDLLENYKEKSNILDMMENQTYCTKHYKNSDKAYLFY